MKTTRLGLAFGVLLLVVLTLATAGIVAAQAGPGDPARGQYIMAINGGCGCHGPDHAGFKPGAPPDQSGSIFQGPFGTVTAKNITPDQQTGVGSWTDDQLINAIRNGIDAEGKPLFPIMPYASFHFMSDGDVRDLVAYLRTLPPVGNDVPENQLNIPVPAPPQLPPSPPVAPTGGVERGRYLVTAITICGDCHTPRLPDLSPDMSRLLAGGAVDPMDIATNLTPDRVTGIGNWTDAQILAVLRYGLEPEGSQVSGLMHDQVVGTPLPGGGYNRLTDSDARDIVAFLRTVPPVSNVAATGAGFQFGFKTLSDLIPDVVGLPLENEHSLSNGDVGQLTTGGLLVWRSADNVNSFTDGSRTWTLTPSGLQVSLNAP